MENSSKIKYTIYTRPREIPRLKTNLQNYFSNSRNKKIIINEKNGYLAKAVLKKNNDKKHNSSFTLPNARNSSPNILKRNNRNKLHGNFTPNKQGKTLGNDSPYLPELIPSPSNGSLEMNTKKNSLPSNCFKYEQNNINNTNNINSNNNSNQLHIILSLKAQLKKLNKEIEQKNIEIYQLRNEENSNSNSNNNYDYNTNNGNFAQKDYNCNYFIQSQEKMISSLSEQNKKGTGEIESYIAKKEDNKKRKILLEKYYKETIKLKEINKQLIEKNMMGSNKNQSSDADWMKSLVITNECSLNYNSIQNENTSQQEAIDKSGNETIKESKVDIGIPKLMGDDKGNQIKTLLGLALGDKCETLCNQIENMKELSIIHVINMIYNGIKMPRNENDELYGLTNAIIQMSNSQGILDKATLTRNMKYLLTQSGEASIFKRVGNCELTNSDVKDLISTISKYDKYNTGYLQYFDLEHIGTSESLSKDLTRNVGISIKKEEMLKRGKQLTNPSVLNIEYKYIEDTLAEYIEQDMNDDKGMIFDFVNNGFITGNEIVHNIKNNQNQQNNEEVMVNNFVNDIFSCCIDSNIGNY